MSSPSDAPRVFVGQAPATVRLWERVAALAGNDASVVVTGESGTGKEEVARALHAGSPYAAGPFVAVSCAAFPDATGRRAGRFEAAHGGTLLLDEVGEIPLAAQAKLLRVLQERSFEPLGTNRTVRVNVRVVAATHRDLRARVASGQFREDLYYRLKVLQVHVPPLRERAHDIVPMARFFAARFARPNPPPRLAASAEAVLRRWSFPGNVRELEHAIRHPSVLSRGRAIEAIHLPEELTADCAAACAAPAVRSPEPPHARPAPLHEELRRFERQHILHALSRSRGRRLQAAAQLGVSRNCLWEKMRTHGIEGAEFER